MPVYSYRCEKCQGEYEEFRSIKADPPETCKLCGKASPSQVFTEPNAIVRGNPKTFGAAAEENAKRVGRESMDAIMEADRARVAGSGFTGKLPKGARLPEKAKAVTPPWRDGSMGIPKLDKPLNLKKVKDKDAYIRTGKV